MPRRNRPPEQSPRIAFLFGSTRRTIVTTITMALSAIAAFGGAVKAWPDVQWAMPAHRGYVLELVSDVKTTTNELLIWKFEDAKARDKNESENWKVQLQKETDPGARALIQQRIDNLNNEQLRYDDRIQKLK